MKLPFIDIMKTKVYFYYTDKNFVLGRANLWCCSISNNKMVKSRFNIYGNGSSRAPTIETRFHHLFVTVTAAQNYLPE